MTSKPGALVRASLSPGTAESPTGAEATPRHLPASIAPGTPLTALAPMQDVTDLAFMGVIAHYGAPDYFFTEFFRVHAQSRLEKHILRAIDENTTGRPVFAQMIGEDLQHLARSAIELLAHPVAGVDLNMGCPAPKVYKKNVGGGLLRDPAKIDEILGVLRQAIPGRFTVKMRIGFEDTTHFERILDLINKHDVDLLSVLANGNITSSTTAVRVLGQTRAAGVMIGRHAIRNPWIFRQCREAFANQPVTAITLGDVREYVERLYRATQVVGLDERIHVNKMKKYLNFVGQSVDGTGEFLHDMRRTESEAQLFAVCDQHLLREPKKLFSHEPYPGVIARPNCETPSGEADGCSL
jgi:tRNA-dihydrouridine synthase